MSSIRDRLKKVAPFEEDLKLMQDIKKTASEQTSKPNLPVEEPVEEGKEEVVEEVKTEEVETPEEVKDRTAEQFEKLKEHNQQLKEENIELHKNVLESLRPDAPVETFTPEVIEQVDKHTTELPQDKVEDIYANLIDKDGYIDPDLLIKTLREANDQAKQARIEAENARKEAREAKQETKRTLQDFEESKEVRLVHKKYPTIDPKNEKFNELFWDDVRKEIATAPYLRGVTVSFMDAADKIWNERYAKKEVEQVTKKQVVEVEDAKKNINASVPSGHSSDYYAKTDTEALRQATIKGVRGSIAERLRRAGQ